MDHRGEITVGVICVITLVLFAISIFLMSIVNPEQLPTTAVSFMLLTTGKPKTVSNMNDDEGSEDKLKAAINMCSNLTTMSSNVTVNVNSTSTTTSNPVATRKGRRSIIDNDASRHLPGVVILQVVDEENQPRVEIVLRSKSSEKIKNQKNDNRKSSGSTNKSNAAVRVVIDLNQNDLIQIVSDDIVVVENVLDSISKENRGSYNMEVLQYPETDDYYSKNEKLAASGPDSSERMYDVGEPTETNVYPASVPFTQHAANLRTNIVHEKKSFVEHNVTSNNKEGTAEVRLPVNETDYMNNTNHSSESVTQHATYFRTNAVHETMSFVEHNVTSNNKEDTVEVRLLENETVYINNTLNVHNHSSNSVTTDDTTEKGDVVYTVEVPSRTTDIINTGGALQEDNSVNKTSNTEYTVVEDNHATESVLMENTMNVSYDTVNTEDTTSKENLDNESFIAEDILELSIPTSNIFMSENAYLEDSLTQLNAASETVKTEPIVNISNDTSELDVQKETLNNSNLATENIDKEDVVIDNTHTNPINIEYPLNKSIPDKVIANLENTIDNRDPANEIFSAKHTS